METFNVSPARFWQKVWQTVGKVPFVDEVVAVWFCARDPATPKHVKAALLGAVAYFVLPFDVVPDLLVGLGYADDFAVLAAVIRTVLPHIKDHHRAQAREALKGRA